MSGESHEVEEVRTDEEKRKLLESLKSQSVPLKPLKRPREDVWLQEYLKFVEYGFVDQQVAVVQKDPPSLSSM